MSEAAAVQTRQREIASEHLLFGDDAIKDNEDVRAIARRMIAGARTQGLD